MGVHLRHSSTASSADAGGEAGGEGGAGDGEHHHSIASLRAKFENLAHGSRSRSSSQSRPAAAAAAAATVSASASVSSAASSSTSTQTAGVPPAQAAVPASTGPVSAPVSQAEVTPTPTPTAPVPIPAPAAQPLPIAARYASRSPLMSSPVSSGPTGQPSPAGGSSLGAANGQGGVEEQPEPPARTPSPQFSVAALRERFGKPGPAQTASQPHSRRPSVEALLHPAGGVNAASPIDQDSSLIQDTPKDTLKPIKDKEPPPLPAKPAGPSVPPKPKLAAGSLSSSSTTGAKDLGSSADSAMPVAAQKRGPAPPPPASRMASPAVTNGLLVASPGPSSRATSPVHRPAPPPPSSGSSQPAVSVTPSTPAKPPLPVRKPTLPVAAVEPPVAAAMAVSAPAAPPIPPASTKPIPSPSSTLLSTSSESGLSVAPPPLPGNKPSAPTSGPSPSFPPRPRAMTFSKSQPPSSLPRLPVRQNTIGPTTGPSYEHRPRAQSVTPDDGFYLPPPPPTRAADGANPSSLKRNATVTVGSMHHHGASTPPRLNGTPGDSDDDDDGPAPPLTTMAQRLLDEHPVSTDANRRPPHFTPDIRITSSQSITAFAVWGRYACVAHSHVKVYDTALGSQVLEIDQHKDTGLEMRAKEPRITALGFRPAKDKAEEGRFLWCGTKDGHIFEVDIKLGAVTTARSSAHGAAVIHIMRHQGWVITLDEAGKLHVWEVLPGEDDDGNFKISRTMRISDKLTFAKMIRGRLWTATAPAVRSTTNSAGARGPTVRVYDICARGSAPPPLTALTSEWTGAATSATLLPENPEKIYLGHEGGFVSIWGIEGEQLQCHQVLKVSTTDILSLEGADKHLWAGNRRGDIHVWNLDEGLPWRTSNIWTAHPDQAVQCLTVDAFGIESSGRFIVWSFSRDDLHGWDGLRGVNWIDKRMVERQPDYCDFRQVRVLVVSWNIDSAKPTDLAGSPANSTFLEEVLGSVESPDIIVFGFQETIPLTDKKLTAKTLLFGSKGKDGGGDRVSGAYRAWADKLSQAVRAYAPDGVAYSKVQSEQLVGLFTCMFVKSSERESLRDVSITTVKRGIGGIYGNKGAIVARMVIDDTSMCFINVHLAAGQKHKATRNADIAAIMEDKVVFPPADRLPYVHGGDGTGILDHEMVVLNGDLNYRIDQRREAVVNCITAGDLSFLLEHDQLRREMRGNHAFRLRSFAEAPIEFNPTYKYDRGTDEYDTSDKRRIPAWCDRVLFTKTPRIEPISYRSYGVAVSDHKPVSAGLAIEIKRIDPSRLRDVYRETQAAWKVHEAKRLAMMVEAYAGVY